MARRQRRQPLRAPGLWRQQCPEAWRGQDEDPAGVLLHVGPMLHELVPQCRSVPAQVRVLREIGGPAFPEPRGHMGPQRGLGPGQRGSWATVTGERQCRVVPADHPPLRPRQCPREDARHRHRSRATPLQQNDVRADADRAAVSEAHRDGRASPADGGAGREAKPATEAPGEKEQSYDALSLSNRSALSAVTARFSEACPSISRRCAAMTS